MSTTSLSGKIREVVAQVGLSFFVSLGVFTLVSAGLEMMMPGWLTDHLPPQSLAGALIVCGAAALLGERRSLPHRAVIVGASAAVVASGLAAWSYFGQAPEMRLGLTAAALLAAGAAFWVAFYPDLGQK